MKKSVVILISLIYVASIALVGFLGLKAQSYNEIVYPESIEILNSYTTDPKTDIKSIKFEASSPEDKQFQLNCRILPDNASDKRIVYAILSGNQYATVDENGLITFSDDIPPYKTITVGIYSKLDNMKSDQVKITYHPPVS